MHLSRFCELAGSKVSHGCLPHHHHHWRHHHRRHHNQHDVHQLFQSNFILRIPTTFLPPRDQRDSRFSRILENFFSFPLLVLDLEPFQFHFHFSKKSEGILFFTFHFSKKVKAIHISLFFLEKKEWNQVRAITSPLSLFPIVFPKIVKSQVSTSLKILAKFQFQNLD